MDLRKENQFFQVFILKVFIIENDRKCGKVGVKNQSPVDFVLHEGRDQFCLF